MTSQGLILIVQFNGRDRQFSVDRHRRIRHGMAFHDPALSSIIETVECRDSNNRSLQNSYPFIAIIVLRDISYCQEDQHQMLNASDIITSESLITEKVEPGDYRSTSPEFKKTIEQELQGLANRQVFNVTKISDVSHRSNVQGVMFVLAIKNPRTWSERYRNK